MSYQDIFTAELQAALRDGATLYDVREPEEYEEGHIPGAVNVPLSQLHARAGEIRSPAVIVCLGGGRSSQAVAYLDAQEMPGIMNLSGGTMAWMREGRELRAGPLP